MISQFFILSPRGDTIITRDYLGNVPKVRASDAPPHLALPAKRCPRVKQGL